MLPSWIRSSSGRPRPMYFRATETTRRGVLSIRRRPAGPPARSSVSNTPPDPAAPVVERQLEQLALGDLALLIGGRQLDLLLGGQQRDAGDVAEVDGQRRVGHHVFERVRIDRAREADDPLAHVAGCLVPVAL